jgi:hypothetical protein
VHSLSHRSGAGSLIYEAGRAQAVQARWANSRAILDNSCVSCKRQHITSQQQSKTQWWDYMLGSGAHRIVAA